MTPRKPKRPDAEERVYRALFGDPPKSAGPTARPWASANYHRWGVLDAIRYALRPQRRATAAGKKQKGRK